MALKIIVYSFGNHCAYSINVPFGVGTRFLTNCSFVYFVPVPSSFVFQLSNVYPVFVNLFDVSFCSTSYTKLWSSIVPVPVFSLNITVYVFTVFSAIAVNSTFCFGIITVVCGFSGLYGAPKSDGVSVVDVPVVPAIPDVSVEVIFHFLNLFVYPSTLSSTASIVTVSPHLYFVFIFVFDCSNTFSPFFDVILLLVPVESPVDFTSPMFSPANVVSVYLSLA